MDDNMEIDFPSPPDSTPQDRVLRRLAQQGVPEEYLDKLYQGIVAFVINKRWLIPETVSAILPTDEEVAEFLRANVDPKIQFLESMTWLQWLMFEGEPAVALINLAQSGQRGVCGAVWGNNDIAYRCRTCEHDPTCAICVPCFQEGNHKDHDYSIIYTGGGCCDCGDVTAWKREGFCSRHKGAEQIKPLPEKFANAVGPVLDALFICWKKKLLFTEPVLQKSSRASDCAVEQRRKFANELTFVIVEMLLEFCKHSESLLCFISRRVTSSDGLLEILVKAERFLEDDVVRKLHELLLKFLGEPIFKYEFAKVFLYYYPFVVNEAVKDSNDNAFRKYTLLSTFSVQIFTVPTLTPRLVKEVNLLDILFGCLGEIFLSCAGEDGCLQISKWRNLNDITIRVVEDIRFVMSHAVVSKYVTHDQLELSRTWVRLLAFVQGMNPLKRETGIHIEEENKNMHLPFIMGHSIANIHNLLVDGAFSVASREGTDDEFFININKEDTDDGDGLRHAKVGRLSQESSVCSATGRTPLFVSAPKVAEFKPDTVADLPVPSSVTLLTYECLRAIENWLRVGDTFGAIPNALSPNNSSNSSSNFLLLKNTLSRKGKYIFGRLTGKGVDLLNANSLGQDSKMMVSSEVNSIACSYAALDDSAMEGDCITESDALRVLSLSDWPEIICDVSSQDISVHIPLHRFLSLLLQKALRRCYDEFAVPSIASASSDILSSPSYMDFFGHILGVCHPYGFSAYVMENPLRLRVFCAQVHAGMWRKNGDAALLSCEWYRSVRWSEQGLELDLFLLQCCAALAPADLYVKRILERFQLWNYLSLNLDRWSEYEPVLVQEMLTLIIQILQERRFCGLTTAESLKRELIHKLAIGDATHSQLMKFLPRELSKFDQLQEILDGVAIFSNPSGFNQGMYSLRWTNWKELDLYHPRWNSRDLQVAEERYLRFHSVSALTTQLPRWTTIYPPLKGIARVATCKPVLQIIRAVLFYSVFTDKSSESRAPDNVLITALHLHSLALDICFQHKESMDRSSQVGDFTPMLAFAGEEIGEKYGAGKQSLLSLLVILMRIHKKENVNSFLEAGNFSLSSLTEHLLKKFAEIHPGCMTKLQELAPEVVSHISQSIPNSDANVLGSASDSEKRKAKARERQAAILAKMRAEQSKFLSSFKSAEDDNSHSGPEVSNSDVLYDSEECTHDVCSLCHDPNSRNPVSFLILLQKSRLLSFVDRGPPSWEKIHQPEKDYVPISTSKVVDQSGVITSTSSSSVREIQLPSTSNDSRENTDGRESTMYDFEIVEQDMCVRICKEMHDNLLHLDSMEAEEIMDAKGVLASNRDTAMLGNYVTALSREMPDHALASETVRNEGMVVESTSQLPCYDGFGPADSDGIHISSCGHAVHQGCLDRYLSSLKERYVRRIVFEGGHIVDPDQGEFLCPVCRRLANSVLPALPDRCQKVWKQPMDSSGDMWHAAGPSFKSSGESNFLRLRQALSLLQSAANMVGRVDLLRALPLLRNERMKLNLESVSRVLSKMYFKNKKVKVSATARVSLSMIMWDTLKYSLMSMEVATRCGRTYMTPTYGLDALFKELKSSSGFVLSLLVKVVQSRQSENSIHALQRFRGLQLFAGSICSGISIDHPSSTSGQGGDMLRILKQVDVGVSYPDIQFWNRASDPILARDPFSSLMWVLFSLPSPFISCEVSMLSLVHIFYVVAAAQAVITYCGKHQCKISEMGLHDCLITDICKILGESGCAQQYFVSNYIDSPCDIKDIIRKLSFPYLRRCALLWKLLNSSAPAPFGYRDPILDRSSHVTVDMINNTNSDQADLNGVQELEKMFKIPSLDIVLKDKVLRSLAVKWFYHFQQEFATARFQCLLHSTPAVPFKLMQLPHVYQDLLQRYIKQACPDCKSVFDEPALCLLCGRLCSPIWKSCCRESGCQTHAMACGAGTGVFLLIRRTTILLQRSARQAPWPSPYLDTFGEEDIEMLRGKPLYLNEERYAALTCMVASHGLDRSSKVLGQTTIGSFFLV
ncbi:zf-UBR domain-containing protein [Cephalotus follicularis]|uniref:E3 ubiquitin-protein ligase n=1 Tax=Cephalotus follicularis TaxID=3775 RepID=A0A1Q3BNK9_CEPFO|nr:zf-UBR domain-containing protein [Cephalotus follicularis]